MINKVLKLQRVGFMTPTVVEYAGKILATNQLDIESTCNLWRSHFGFYPTEKIYLAMTRKEFSAIQQKTLPYVRSVYDLFYEQDFIPRTLDPNEEGSEWNMYRENEVEKLKAENAALREKVSITKRALREFAVQCGCNNCPFLGRCNISPDAKGDYQGCFNMYLSIAEKELAEEGKNEMSYM